jgi:CubicO group peptidase (beta-lactamase class C family)
MPPTEKQLEQVDCFLQRTRRELRLPGLAVAIVHDGQVLLSRGYGRADQQGRMVDEHTPFILGSVSKTFTALAICQLAGAGKLELDAPVVRYIPWFRVRDKASSGRITVRHLLTHTSGLSRAEGRRLLAEAKSTSLEAGVRALRRVRLTRPVGEAYQYSNSGYMVLGLLIEVVSGQPYETYLQKHVFSPLNMCHSYASELPASDDHLTTGYRWWFGWPRPAQLPYPVQAVPAAFLISSASDLARYLRACLDAGRTESAALLSESGFTQLFTPAVQVVGQARHYALGWQVEKLGGDTVLRHGGETANFLADMLIVPSKQLGVVALLNAGNGALAQLGIARVATGVAALLMGQPVPKAAFPPRTFSALSALSALLLTIAQLWAWKRFFAGLQRPRRLSWPREALALVPDLLTPLAVLWRLPKRFDMTWPGADLYVPDLSRVVLGLSSLSLMRALLRVLKWLRFL